MGCTLALALVLTHVSNYTTTTLMSGATCILALTLTHIVTSPQRHDNDIDGLRDSHPTPGPHHARE